MNGFDHVKTLSMGGAIILAAAPLFGHDESVESSAGVFAPPMESLDRLDFLKTGDPLQDWNPQRVWQSIDGRSLSAKLIAADEKFAVFRLSDEKRSTVPLSRLSEADRRFVEEWREISLYFDPGFEKRRSIANTVEAGIRDGAFAKEGKVHETRNFRFECDAPLNAEVVRDFSRLFEATYLAVQANPLGLAIAEPAGGKFAVRLFSKELDYISEGGDRSSAGMYLIRERTMLVPLSSLGLVEGPRGFRKARNFDPRTLIHETTHALTHQWLNRVPLWFVEGLAEYIAAIPYEDGVMNFDGIDQGIVAQVNRKLGGRPEQFSLPDPAELVVTGDFEFMARPEPPEPVVKIEPVKPFQIAVVKSGEEEPEETTASAETMKPEAETEMTGEIPPIEPPGNSGPEVVTRYVASMLLVNHFLKTNQDAALRKYLFAHLVFEWDRNRYLHEFDATYKGHREAVEAQIAEFNEKVARFNAGLRKYNDDVDAYNSGASDKVPEVPLEPKIPDALEVPEILSKPRSPEDFSRVEFRERVAEEYLDLPARTVVPE